MCRLYFFIGTAFSLLATCIGVSKCPNGTFEEENATALVNIINGARRKLGDGLQTTVNGTLLPPAKNMNVLQWDCEMEEKLIEMTPKACNDFDYEGNFFWFTYDTESFENFFAYIKECLAKVENKAPTNITSEAVYFYDENCDDWYELWEYSHLIRPSTRNFACIRVDGQCVAYGANKLLFFCGTEQERLKNGDIFYEIAKATTSTAETSMILKSSTTSSATASSVTISSVTTSSTAGLNITRCATPTMTPICPTVPPRRVKKEATAPAKNHLVKKLDALEKEKGITESPRREAKAAHFKSFLMKKAALAKRRGKTHRKQLRNTPMTLTAHRKHAAKTTTGN
ncbi:unnamed protein product [Cylicocyclus nassatus]|uniref:SCP domain-containing protein n=1 Tax=Cylicocyclus nassatus TaxID=53992 RepID=A0AA36GHU3_CYLNA|nr:unnamed protein product [Cylicocyclus nassatus]